MNRKTDADAFSFKHPLYLSKIQPHHAGRVSHELG